MRRHGSLVHCKLCVCLSEHWSHVRTFMQEDSTKTTGCAHFLKGVVDSHNGTEATDRAGCCCVDHLSLFHSLFHAPSLILCLCLSGPTPTLTLSLFVSLVLFPPFFFSQISYKANTDRSSGTNFGNLKPTLKWLNYFDQHVTALGSAPVSQTVQWRFSQRTK